MKVVVLRLGHRIFRDKRLTTHVCLIARALGANSVVFTGEEDKSVIESVEDIVKRWGGPFEVKYEKNWRAFLKKNSDFEIIHLTMYGLPYQDCISEIRKSKKDKLIIVGSEKVPSEVYHCAKYNLAITNQPHSEAAALAVFLHDLFEGKELDKKFKDSELKIIPNKCGKTIIKSQ